MKVSRRIVWDMETLVIIEKDSYDYEGPIDVFCGGPTGQQKAAATSTGQLSQEQAQIAEQNAPQTQAFYENEMNNGLPYFGAQSQYSTSAVGNQIDQAKAQQASQMAGYGSALPSGFAASAQRDLSAQGAQAFDQNQLQLLQAQQQAKQQGAAGLSGQGAQSAQTAVGGNQSIMQAPLQNNFWSNLVGGLVSGAGSLGTAWINNN